MNPKIGLSNVKITALDGNEVSSMPTVELEIVDQLSNEEQEFYDKLLSTAISIPLKPNSALKKLLKDIKKQWFKYIRTKKSIKKRKKHYWR